MYNIVPVRSEHSISYSPYYLYGYKINTKKKYKENTERVHDTPTGKEIHVFLSLNYQCINTYVYLWLM